MFEIPAQRFPSSPTEARFPLLSPLRSCKVGGLFRCFRGSPPSACVLRLTPREEKTEQLVDTRHEVDQLVLELQKVKQEVSRVGRGGPELPSDCGPRQWELPAQALVPENCYGGDTCLSDSLWGPHMVACTRSCAAPGTGF